MGKCLVIVDLQNDYFPGGKMELFKIEKAADNGKLIRPVRKNCKY